MYHVLYVVLNLHVNTYLFMKKLYTKTLLLFVFSLLTAGNSLAEDLVFGTEYTAIASLTEWDYTNISGSYIMSKAQSIKIKVYNSTYVKIVNGNTIIKEFSWNSDNQAGVSIDISGTNLDLAKNGSLDAWTGGFDGTAYLTITNYATEDGASNDTGSAGTGGDSGSGDSGSGTNTNNLAAKIANREQLTNLPTVYFTIPAAIGKDINEVLYKDRKTNDAPYFQTTIQVVDNSTSADGRPIGSFIEDSLYIKVRGNSTAEMDKRPYRLKFCKDEKDASSNVTKSYKHDMLGYGYKKRNWTILNNLRDGTLMQNAITYYIGKVLGFSFCPGYKFVDLVINDEYRGNYMLSDHCEVGSNRIDVNEDTGWFVESTRADMVEEPYVYAGALNVLIKNPESDTDEGTAAIKTEVKNYFDNINNAYFGIWATGCDDETFCDPQKGWRTVFDEETLVKMYLGINLTGDFDGFMQVKMYREADGKLYFGPLWDKDLAFGVQGNDNTLVEGNDFSYGGPIFANYMNKLINKDPVFAKKVHDKLHDMVDKGYVNTICAEIDKLETMLTESKTLEYNNTGWKAVSVDGYPEAVTKLKTYITDHTAWLVETIDAKYEALGGSSIVDNTTTDDTPTTTDDTSSTRAQLTDVPTIYIDTDNTTDGVTDSWGAASIEVYDKDNKLQGGTTWSLTSTGLETAVDVQYQGSGKADSKNSYRMKFATKRALIGSNKYKQWVLSSNDDDPSMINNALAKVLGDNLDMPFTPGYQFVDLYINGEYMGTYQLTDRIKAEKGRSLVSSGDKDEDWQIQFDAPSEIKENDNSVYVAATETTPYIVIKNPDPDDLNETEITTLKQTMSDWFIGTNNGANFFTNVESNVNKDQLISWYIGMEILCSYKGLSSVEAYKSVTTGVTDQLLHMGPFWDNEKSFGNVSANHPIDMSDINTEGSYEGLITEYSDYKVMRKWLKKLWQQKWFAKGVLDKWNTLYGESATTDLKTVLETTAGTISNSLSQTQAKNAAKWTSSLGNYNSYSDAVAAISTYLDKRFSYLDVKFKEMYSLAEAETGDVNVDGNIDVDDVTAIAMHINDNYTGKFSKSAADVNGDGEINIADVAALVNMLNAK